MASTYGERVKSARLNAKLSQAELGRQIGSSAQAIQYLEEPDNAAQGSHKTAHIAHICGVNALWLETGEGTAAPSAAREPGAEYQVHSARSIAQAIQSLRPELRRAVGVIVSSLGVPAGRRFAISGGEQMRESVRPRTRRRSAERN